MTSADEFVLQILADKGLVPADRIARAVERPGEESAFIQEWIETGLISPGQVMDCMAEAFQMEVVDFESIEPDPEALRLLPLKTARQYQVFPLAVDAAQISVAISDPLDMDTVDTLGHMLGKAVNPLLATAEQIVGAINRHYRGADMQPEVSSLLEDWNREDLTEGGNAGSASPVGGKGGDLLAEAAKPDAGEGPIIQYVQMLITEAVRRRASDIHLEPLEKRFRVRFRVDGVLQEMESPPKRLQPSIISRLKIMAKISIAEKRIPLDGRIAMKIKDKAIDLRVSSLPTAFGESIVMRILDKEGLRLGLPQLGFFSDDQATFERLISMADGIFLVTGPTGSGKSTTLYSALNYINKPDRKIITVEDPVEYEMMGINQVQVREDVGMTFAAALRSMLRQAPNIIMVGEIRDLETAEIAVNASLTGHMVYSTLHTNDAPSAVSRLINIGVKPFLVSASLRGILAQRLVRQIDPDHFEPYTPTPGELAMLGITPDQAAEAAFRQGVPHAANGHTGFRGRKGIFEIFEVDEDMQQMIYEHKSLVDLRRAATRRGMRSMREDGFRKVLAGITTLQEVLNVTVEGVDA